MGYFRENIEKLDGYVPGFQPADTDVVKLNTNENPYPPSPKVIEAINGIHPCPMLEDGVTPQFTPAQWAKEYLRRYIRYIDYLWRKQNEVSVIEYDDEIAQ